MAPDHTAAEQVRYGVIATEECRNSPSFPRPDDPICTWVQAEILNLPDQPRPPGRPTTRIGGLEECRKPVTVNGKTVGELVYLIDDREKQIWVTAFARFAERKPATVTEAISYHDFELLVMADQRIRASWLQGTAWGELQLDVTEIEATLTEIEEGRTDAQMLEQLGRKLYEALFPREIYAQLKVATSGADRVRLRLAIESAKLAALPWEFLYDPETGTFLANSIQTALSRYIDVPATKRVIGVASPPLRILVVISSPTEIAGLRPEEEEQIIRQALAKHLEQGRIEIDVLKTATIGKISQQLREKDYHVFHFIGHGYVEGDKGFLVLVDEDGGGVPLDDRSFASFFSGYGSLGLVVLNACQGAAASANQAFAGMAPLLVQKRIPAVIAMQYSVSNETARLFADQFYSTLAQGWPVDAAVQTTRNTISIKAGLDRPDFATPVLYMQAEDGVILRGL